MEFIMDDGSELFASGNVTDLTESSIFVNSVVLGGACDQALALTTLTRQ